MEFTIVDIPDPISTIAVQLSFHGITQCVIVSRDLHHHFQKYLRRDVSILDLARYPPIKSRNELTRLEQCILSLPDACEMLPSKRRFVESLAIHFVTVLTKPGPTAFNLRRPQCTHPECSILQVTRSIYADTIITKALFVNAIRPVDNNSTERTTAVEDNRGLEPTLIQDLDLKHYHGCLFNIDLFKRCPEVRGQRNLQV
jgi:hypothetical protein